MKIREKFDELIDVLEESENDEVKNRFKAALVVGARVALEHVVLRGNGYITQADVTAVLSELDESPALAPAALVAEAAPTVGLTPVLPDVPEPQGSW